MPYCKRCNESKDLLCSTKSMAHDTAVRKRLTLDLQGASSFIGSLRTDGSIKAAQPDSGVVCTADQLYTHSLSYSKQRLWRLHGQVEPWF